jgi:hypothetical protein
MRPLRNHHFAMLDQVMRDGAHDSLASLRGF